MPDGNLRMSAADPLAGTVDFVSDVTEASAYANLTVNIIVFDQENERALLGCKKGLVRVYVASTGALLLRFSGHERPAGEYAVCPSKTGSASSSRGVSRIAVLGPDISASVNSVSVMLMWCISSGNCLYHVACGIARVAKIDENSFVAGSMSGELAFYRRSDGATSYKFRSSRAYPPCTGLRDSDGDLFHFRIAVWYVGGVLVRNTYCDCYFW